MTINSDEDFKSRIIEVLKKYPEGLTIQDISKILKAHRQTVSKYILVLEAVGLVYRRRIGPITLNYLKKFVSKNWGSDVK
jgi:predicted transcriptional regulator